MVLQRYYFDVSKFGNFYGLALGVKLGHANGPVIGCNIGYIDRKMLNFTLVTECEIKFGLNKRTDTVSLIGTSEGSRDGLIDILSLELENEPALGSLDESYMNDLNMTS